MELLTCQMKMSGTKEKMVRNLNSAVGKKNKIVIERILFWSGELNSVISFPPNSD